METVTITEEKAFDQDVKTMSYDELMATIRYLDHERQIIATRVHKNAENTQTEEKVTKRAA